MKKNNITKELKTTSLDRYVREQYPTKASRRKFNEGFSRLSLGYEIYQARKKRNLTQSALAKRIATTQSEVARIENGDQNVTTDKLNKIAKALDKKLKISLT